MELAGIGITASIELYRATGQQKYADKAVELARTRRAMKAIINPPTTSSAPAAIARMFGVRIPVACSSWVV